MVFVLEKLLIHLMNWNLLYKNIGEKHFIQLYKRNSQTVGSALKRTQNRKINKELKHVRLLYSCIHRGRKFSTTSTGKRPNTR